MKRRLERRDETGMTAAVEALLERAPEPVCSTAVREALEERVMAGLPNTHDGRALDSRRARRRIVDDRSIGLGKLPRTAVIKRAVLVPALVLVLLAVMTAGAYALSAGANPDSALYGVKLFFERARFEMTGSDLARAELGLQYAEKRMAELEFMVSKGINNGAQDWLKEYEGNLRETKEYSAKLQGDVAIDIQARLGRLAEAHLQLLQSLSLQATFDLSPAIVEALDVCSEIGMSSQNFGSSSNNGSGNGGPGATDSSSAPPGEVYTSPVETRTYDPNSQGENQQQAPPSLDVPDSGSLSHPSDPYSIPNWPWPSLDWWQHVEVDKSHNPSWP